ncbi:MAG TPA: universal stress protein [Streptosporangiaceae bacterium]|nr:universal stress protein [Streptosporangiaceae bacterium]
MDKTILLAVDTTSHTAAAADMTAELAGATGDRVVVLHVHEFAIGRFGRMQVDCAEGVGEQVVTEIVARLRAAGVAADADIRRTPVGHIARTVLAVAHECAARLIILGSTSGHDVPRLPFGSVSLRLLHIADKPVLIVPRSLASSADRMSAAVGAAHGAAH